MADEKSEHVAIPTEESILAERERLRRNKKYRRRALLVVAVILTLVVIAGVFFWIGSQGRSAPSGEEEATAAGLRGDQTQSPAPDSGSLDAAVESTEAGETGEESEENARESTREPSPAASEESTEEPEESRAASGESTEEPEENTERGESSLESEESRAEETEETDETEDFASLPRSLGGSATLSGEPAEDNAYSATLEVKLNSEKLDFSSANGLVGTIVLTNLSYVADSESLTADGTSLTRTDEESVPDDREENGNRSYSLTVGEEEENDEGETTQTLTVTIWYPDDAAYTMDCELEMTRPMEEGEEISCSADITFSDEEEKVGSFHTFLSNVYTPGRG